jgi:hypothetical protein
VRAQEQLESLAGEIHWRRTNSEEQEVLFAPYKTLLDGSEDFGLTGLDSGRVRPRPTCVSDGAA